MIEKNYSEKLEIFVDAIAKLQPDIIALQEVNQTCCKETVSDLCNKRYISCKKNIEIKSDNHILKAVEMLEKKNLKYYWTWFPIKNGYHKFDEGIGLMSLAEITETDVIAVSNINDYNNWKTRKIIGIRTKNTADEWFYSVHYGWWDDREELFCNQWEKTVTSLQNKHKVWLMGDFNNPADVKNEGYDLINKSRFRDSFIYAKEKDEGTTVYNNIDGWRDNPNLNGMRIDQIWSSFNAEISYSKVIFNGRNYPVVSDHCGVIVEWGI